MVPVVLNETDDYFNSMPPGFRFVPTDEVLILCYLRKKLLNEPLPINRIRHVNIYQYHPRDLTAMYDLLRESEWYYFTPITRKYVNSSRPNRVAPNGFWKPRMNNPIKDRNNEVVGYRTSLEFYEGKYPNGNKTGWKMNEYTINEAIIPPNINTNGKTRIKVPQIYIDAIFFR
ncbi:putative transcription factor NAM family [Rosa chinensis]|uniref:Putative transcription factor NAM family n=1 Tax=Rosa chinensis TaxID=74649 RepID=A0A2P6RDY8_ROSCH|nr:putative transcription factor NAM family [Rosa chinensis]